MFQKRITKVTLCCLLFIHIQASGYTGFYHDQTSSRTNTLFDDADDIQRQLDNEARDRMKFGGPKTIWVFHFPTHFPDHNSILGSTEEQIRCRRHLTHTKREAVLEEEENPATPPCSPSDDWNYTSQETWAKTFPECGAKSQSPVDLPVAGLIKPRGTRPLMFQNHDVVAKSMTLMNDGKQTMSALQTLSDRHTTFAVAYLEGMSFLRRPVSDDLYSSLRVHLRDVFSPLHVSRLNWKWARQGALNNLKVIVFGEWKNEQRPLIYGGAAHSRRYLFHSLIVHLPAEHTVGTLYYPLETQFYYVSAEYKDMDQALESTSDSQAILTVTNLYSYGNHTHQGLIDIFTAAKNSACLNATLKRNSLFYFNPPFKEYACYQGSMTTPPCTESVLWLIRGRTLHISRKTWEAARTLINDNSDSKQNFRVTQPLNDRKVFFFK